MPRFNLILAWMLLAIAADTFAQTRPATSPTTSPATTRARRAIVVPPGFKTLTVNQRTALIESADEPWVRQALEAQKPTTMPTTMPADVLGQLRLQRDQLTKQITTDLALSESAGVQKAFADKLEPQLQKIDDVNPHLYYLVCTERRTIDLIKSGWSDPRLYYNRAADRIQMQMGQLSGSNDDILQPIFYAPDATPQKRTESLSATISRTEGDLALFISEQTAHQCVIQFSDLVNSEAIEPLHLKPDQQWMGIGLARNLACHYTATITGAPRDLLLANLTRVNTPNPLRLSAVDLLHPVQPSEMRREAIPIYTEAYERKSMRAVLAWLKAAGDEAVPKLLVELRKKLPEDGPALVKLLQQIGGPDITSELGPGQ